MPTTAPTTIDERDLKRRHPLCPYCGYDLVATIAANKRICPECGEAFAMSDLVYERRPGDWDVGRATLLGGRALALRSLLGLGPAIALAAGAIVCARLDLPRVVPFLIAIVQACLMGWIFSRRLVDQAGFESVLLTIGACVCVALVSGAGYVVAARWVVALPLGGLGFVHNVICIFGACVWIIHQMLLDQ